MVRLDVTPRVNLALKVTNWCNLNCAHCCERSHANEPFNLMPIDKIERYICEFKDMGIPVWDYVTFTGGETMAPYYIGQHKYIPTVADICAKNNMSACFKTNALWGNKLILSGNILKSLADIAHKHDRQISLDISIDEYHDNMNAAANVVDQIMNSQYLSAAFPVSFVGLNTPASQYKYQEFANILRQRRIYVDQMDSDGSIIMSKGDNLNVMFYEIGALSRLGRAADNELTQHIPNGYTDCLMITNDDQAILNYKHKTTVANKTIGQAYNELIQKKR